MISPASHELVDALGRLGAVGAYFHPTSTGRVFGDEVMPEAWELLTVRGPFGQVVMWHGLWMRLLGQGFVAPVRGLGPAVDAYLQAEGVQAYALQAGR